LHLFYNPLKTAQRHIFTVPGEIIVLFQALKAMDAMEIAEAGGSTKSVKGFASGKTSIKLCRLVFFRSVYLIIK